MAFILRIFWRRKRSKILVLIQSLFSMALLFFTLCIYQITYGEKDVPLGFETKNILSVELEHPINNQIFDDLEFLRQRIETFDFVSKAGIITLPPFSEYHQYEWDQENMVGLDLLNHFFVLKVNSKRNFTLGDISTGMDEHSFSILGLKLLSGYDMEQAFYTAPFPAIVGFVNFNQFQQRYKGKFKKPNPHNFSLAFHGVVENYRPYGEYVRQGNQRIDYFGAQSTGFVDIESDVGPNDGNLLVKINKLEVGDLQRISDLINNYHPNWVVNIRWLEDMHKEANAKSQLPFLIFLGFTGFFLVLSSLGMMGVLQQEVSLRKAEIAILRAIGSSKQILLKRLLWDAGVLIILVGIIFAIISAAIPILLPFIITWKIYAFAYVSSLVVLSLFVLGFSIYPSYGATNIEPSQALMGQ